MRASQRQALLCFGLWFSLTPGLRAQTCVNYNTFVRQVGFLQMNGTARGILVDEGLAFVLGYPLRVVDVSRPEAPRLLGQVPVPGFGSAAARAGSHLFMVSEGFGLVVVDVAVPESPRVVQRLETPGRAARHLVLRGPHLYVADGGMGVHVFDVTNPSAPVRVGTIATPGYAMRLALAGDELFVLSSELQIFALADPTAPTLLGAFPVVANGVAVRGSMAFLVGNHEVLALDVYDPSSPHVVGTFSMPWARSILLRGERAYVSTSQLGLRILDVSEPTAMRLIGRVPVASPDGVAVEGRFTYVFGDWMLRVFDVANLADVLRLAEVELPSRAGEMAVDGDRAYVLGGMLTIFDVAVPESPTVLGSSTVAGERITLQGHHAYIASREHGVRIVDVSDPSNLRHLADFDTPGTARAVAVRGTHAFVADQEGGFTVLDVADSYTPRFVQRIFTAGFATDVVTDGKHAFVADELIGLAVVDVSVPESPRLVASFAMATPRSMEIEGSTLFATTYSQLLSVDVTNPRFPVIVGRLDLGVGAILGVGELALAGRLAYVALPENGFWALDMADASAPRVLGGWSPPSGAIVNDIEVAGNHVFVLLFGRWLRVFPAQCEETVAVGGLDVAARAAVDGIRLTWSVHAPELWSGFSVGRNAESHSGGGGFEALQAAPQQRSRDHWEFLDRAVVPSQTYTYVVTGHRKDGGASVVGRITVTAWIPSEDMRLWPNPTTGLVQIQFWSTLEPPAVAAVEVVDAAGRLLRELRTPIAPGGRSSASWDGLDAEGRRVASGVYFIRIRDGRERPARRVIVVR